MNRLLFASIVWGCGGGPPAASPAGPGGHRHQHGHHHAFDDPAQWSARWDTPERDAWQRPDAVIAKLALAADARIADLGAGTGYFALRFAKAAPAGQTYAVDLEPKMVEFVRARAAEAGVANLTPVLAEPADPRLPEAVDLIFVCNTYHHIGDRTGYFGRLRDRLRPGGRLVIVDYQIDAPGEGPPREMRIGPDQLAAELAPAGYREVARDEALLPRQYLAVFAPTGQPDQP